jgi:formiminoglutamase
MVKDKLEELLIYFDPVKRSSFADLSFLIDKGSLGSGIIINYDDKPITSTDRFELALVFVTDFLIENDAENIITTQVIREEIYKLKKLAVGLRMVDLGNLRSGRNLTESKFALQEACSILLQLKINIVIIGGSQSLTVANFRAIKEFENDINIVHIDSRIDLSVAEDYPADDAYLSQLIEQEGSHLYNISCVGHQAYFVDQKQINRLNELYFEHYRLGIVKDNLSNIEPVLRDADLISFDIGAVKACDAPARKNNSPNGFFSDEACQLARYAGISDRVRSFGIYETDARIDINNHTSKLVAQMVWYYIDGFLNRKHEFPLSSLDDCIKYIVEIDEIEIPIVFYKSNKTQRWWIEVKSLLEDVDNKVNVIAACSETDYFKACNNEIPERWWINFKKLR